MSFIGIFGSHPLFNAMGVCSVSYVQVPVPVEIGAIPIPALTPMDVSPLASPTPVELPIAPHDDVPHHSDSPSPSIVRLTSDPP